MKTRNAALATSINKKRYMLQPMKKSIFGEWIESKWKLTTSSYISYLHKHSHYVQYVQSRDM